MTNIVSNRYQEKQRQIYQESICYGKTERANDALWRAASNANLLENNERSYHDLTTERITFLMMRLGWI